MKSLFFTFSFLLSSSAFAWGQIGHRVIGEVAMQHLTPEVKKEVYKILDGEDLAMVANYGDFVKSSNDPNLLKWSKWHYLNAPKGQTYLESRKNPDGDVVQGLMLFEDRLRDKKLNHAERQFALKEFVHLVGDSHQPFHAGYPDDRGGNTVEIEWFDHDGNLHWLWDDGMIDSQQLSYTEYVKFITPKYKKNIKKYQDSNYLDWVNESRSYLDKAYADLGSGKYWEFRYMYLHIEEVNERLYASGIRLADKLNTILANKPMTKKDLEARKLLQKK